MGIKSSKTAKTVKINDFSMVKIPDDYALIKISSYNVNLRNSVNLDVRVKEIITYISSNYKNKQLDIINLQGIYDTSSLYVLIRDIKKYFSKNNIKIYTAPNFDDIDVSNTSANSIISSKKMFNISFNSPSDKNTDINKPKRKISQNIIISKFEIIGTVYSELDDKTDMDDILGIQTVIGANILIGERVMCVYNTSLSKDIKSANIINDTVRQTELATLFKIIQQNIKQLNIELKYSSYYNSDVNILLGTFNIEETQENKINTEFTNLIQNSHCIDIYRYLNDDDPGYTTSFMERVNYIFMCITSDLYNKDSPFYKKIQKMKTSNELFDIIFKRYGIHFLDSSVIKNTDNNSLVYYPIESIFLFCTKDKKIEL